MVSRAHRRSGDASEPGNVNTGANEGAPAISSNSRTLYFYSDRSGGFGGNDLYSSTREKTSNDGTSEGPLGRGREAAAIDERGDPGLFLAPGSMVLPGGELIGTATQPGAEDSVPTYDGDPPIASLAVTAPADECFNKVLTFFADEDDQEDTFADPLSVGPQVEANEP